MTSAPYALEAVDVINEDIPLGTVGADHSPVQRTMFAFARTMATDARVLILDEPTASLTDTEIVDVFAVLNHRLQGCG